MKVPNDKEPVLAQVMPGLHKWQSASALSSGDPVNQCANESTGPTS